MKVPRKFTIVALIMRMLFVKDEFFERRVSGVSDVSRGAKDVTARALSVNKGW